MNRFMWFFAMIPVIVTSIVLQFMPDVIPMHHDLAGNTNRWGSKMESLIFPITILFITLFGITGGSKPTIDIAKVSCILGGMMFVVLGNIMTKAKKNYCCFCKRKHLHNSYAGISHIGKCNCNDIFKNRI